MKSFIAGAILDNLWDYFEKKSKELDSAKKLAHWLSHFNLKSKSKFEENKIEYAPVEAVLINLLQRGTPTRLNFFAFEFLIDKSEVFEKNTENESSFSIKSIIAEDRIRELIFKSLHVIEPRIKLKEIQAEYLQSWEKLGSKFEEDFLFDILPNNYSKNGAFLLQLITSQRSLRSIVSENVNLENLKKKVLKNFDEQRTDFTLEFPYTEYINSKGIVIEIDGPQHELAEQQFLDIQRDLAICRSGWFNSIRIKTSEFYNSHISSKITDLFIPAVSNDFIKITEDNFLEPIWSTPLGSNILQLTLIPFGVARIQRAFLEFLANNKFIYEQKTVLKIAVVERDVPCAKLAFDDFNELILSYNRLKGKNFILPEVDLEIFSTLEFINSNYQADNAMLISEFNKSTKYDLLLDVAVLERNECPSFIATEAVEIITIKSVQYLKEKRKIITSDMIHYPPFCSYSNENGGWEISDGDFKKGLDYFLKSIFRKNNFRSGQLPIMHNALQCKSVIGLLPTGGGKSLTYQLSAMLQPGICLVIDPIRSLMKDQVDGLNRNLISSCVFINSTLQGKAKEKAISQLADGEVQFAFISPERLQIPEFRLMLYEMHNKGHYFSYCVIDEVHCVSEWGHDFRTAYLRLGENAVNFCKTKNLVSIPFFGLTATASYDVLADVQRELSGNKKGYRLTEDAIVRSEYTKRNELQYIVKDVTFTTDGINTIWDLKRILSSQKQDQVKELLSSIPKSIFDFQRNAEWIFTKRDWDNNSNKESEEFSNLQISNYCEERFFKENNGGLIFCPHKSGYFGVTDKFQLTDDPMPKEKKGYFDILKSYPDIKVGYFMGTGNARDQTSNVIDEESMDNQDKFINNELNLMIATKAFGMGIDKENIRYTIHINYPNSIESYIQEAGRAGRDGKLALSYILFNDQKVKLANEKVSFDHDFDINMYFYKNSFKGVQKELAVLDELLTEIYFPDRTFELENIINNRFGIEVRCSYYESSLAKNLYFDVGYQEPLGYYDLITQKGYSNYKKKDGTIIYSVSQEISDAIWPLLSSYIESQNLNEPLHLWLLKGDKKMGLEEILKSKNTGAKFSLTIGFNNNTRERLKTITRWLNTVLNSGFKEGLVQRMKDNSNDANAFIEQVIIEYKKFTNKELNLKAFCDKRDVLRGVPVGTAFSMFMKLFNGYRDKQDTEKAIFRLVTLGIVDDYTVNFSSRTFNLTGTKKTNKEYKEILREYLCKYYSEKTAEDRLNGLSSIKEKTYIRKCIQFLIPFIYENISNKRLQAIKDFKNACRQTIELGKDGPIWFKDFIDLYFNSKYARMGYRYYNSNNIEINASLPEITDNGKKDEVEFVWFFIRVIDEDKTSGSQIDNLKHLRGACVRMASSIIEPSFTIKMLSAYALFMIEYNNEKYLLEAHGLISEAFSIMHEKFPHFSEEEIKEIHNIYFQELSNRNSTLLNKLEEFNISISFEDIVITSPLKTLTLAVETLNKLNKILDANV